MNAKTDRLDIITQIIVNGNVRSQQEILEILKTQGIEITQACLSRYLKQIQASRKLDDEGRYVYRMPEDNRSAEVIITNQLKSVEFAGPNMVVFRTSSGFANAVSVQIDSRRLEAAAGTVSGDDTILMIVRDGYTRAAVRQMLIREFPYIKDKIVNG